MASCSKRDDVVTGLWKFKDSVPVNELLQLATDWMNGPDGERYIHLYVRRCSKDQYGIGFMYQFEPSNDERTPYKNFFHKMTDILKRRFGNDFVGYDVSSPTWIFSSLPPTIS